MFPESQIAADPRAVINLAVAARAQFLSRVYTHLFGALVAFTLFEVALFQTGLAAPIAKAMMSVPWLAILGAWMLISWFATRAAHNVTSKGMQYAGLVAYVFGMGLLTLPLLAYAEVVAGGGVIASAGFVTLGGFTGLTAIGLFSRKDFSFLGGLLKWGFLLAIGFIVASLLFGFNLGLVFSFAMVGLAGAAILYDTQKILHEYPEDRYVGASLQLFASVALMFWYVLRIFLATRD